MFQLEVKLLGELSIWQEGKQLKSLRSKKGLALLSYLAVTGQAWSRLYLAGLFWPDKPEADALMNLRKVLHLLNQNLAPYLHVTRESVALTHMAPVLVDALEFESAARIRPPTLSSLDQASKLYRGSFLEGFYLPDCAKFEDWMIVYREALQSLALDTFWRLSGERRKRGDYTGAEQSARRHITLDNLDERGHRDLMEVLALQGRGAEALQQLESCRRILEAELGVEPSPQTLTLAERIRQNKLTGPEIEKEEQGPVGDTDTEPGPTSTSLPARAPLIGRQNELSTLRSYLQEPASRIITIVGPGGIGKTSLAIALAWQESERFGDGVCYVSLDSIKPDGEPTVESAGGAIVSAITASLGHPLQPGDITRQLHELLREQHLLLVLDNIEHLIAGAPAVADLVEAAPRLVILTTSRQPLGLYGEQLLPLTGLAYDIKQVTEADAAVQLFAQRARRLDPTFALSEEDTRYLTRICMMVDGSPLALELTAANLEGFSLRELADELNDSLQLLSTTWTDVPERHRNMRSVFDASWRYLSPEEQQIFNCMSVFRDGVDSRAVQAVCAPHLSKAACRTVVAGLIRKSLVNYDRASGRYGLHHLLMRFAAEQLALSTDTRAEVIERHSHYFITLLHQRDRDWNTAAEYEAVNTLQREAANIRKAWQWALDHEQWSRLSRAFYSWQSFHRWQISITEFNDVCTDIMQRTGSSYPDQPVHSLQLRAKALISLIWSEPNKQKVARMIEEAERILTTTEKRGGDVTVDRATLLRDTAFLVVRLGDVALAVNQLERSKSLFEQQGKLWDSAAVEANLAVIDWRNGRHASAINRQERVLAIARHLGSERSEGAAAFNLGLFLRSLGQFDEAEQLQRTALEKGQRQHYGLALTRYTVGLAQTLLWQGRADEATRLMTDALSAAQASHFPQYVAWTRAHLAEIQIHSGRYHQARGHLEQAQLLLREQNASYQLPDGGSIYTMLGELALVRGAWTEADAAFDRGREILEPSWHQLDLIFPLAGMGRSALGKGRFALARQKLVEALSNAITLRSYPGLVYTLPIVALYFAETGDDNRALALWELAHAQPFVRESAWFVDVVKRALSVRLGVELPEGAGDEQESDLWQAASDALDALDS